jgi:hypothetical protein
MKRAFGFVLVIACSLLVQAARAADTVIGFDDLPSGTVVSNQYSGAGVVLAGIGTIPTIIQLPSGVAQSGTQALNITAVAEVSETGLSGHFPFTRQHVGVFVGDWGRTTHPVTLAIYDPSGVEIAEKTVTVTGGAGIHTQLTVSSSSENIHSFRIFIPGPQAQFARVAVDDFSFDNPATPTGPDFGIALNLRDDLGIGVTRGGSYITYIGVTLVNGSAGALQFTASGLPQGVSVSFSANQTNFADGAQVALTFVAQPTVPLAINLPVTIMATPQDSLTGPGPHPVQIQLTVAGTFVLRVNGIEVTEGTQQFDLPTRDPVNPAAPVPYRGVLFDGSNAIVRVFADAQGLPTWPGVTGVWAVLFGTDIANNPLPGSPLGAEFGPPFLIDQHCVDTRGVSCVPQSQRTDPTAAFTFTLPSSWWLNTGISLTAQLLPPPDFLVGPPPPFVPCATPDCLVQSSLTLTGVTYAQGFGGEFTIAALQLISQNSALPPNPFTVFKEAKNVTPLDIMLTGYYGSIDITGVMISAESRDDKNSDVLNMVEDWDEDNGFSVGSDFSIGVTTEDLGVENGGIVFTSNRPLAVVDSKSPLTDVAHEVFHGLGIFHASAGCGGGDNGQTAAPWPDSQGFLEGIGVDRRSGSGGAGAPFRIIASTPTSNKFDFMSYCTNRDETVSWISPINWHLALTSQRAAAELQRSASAAETQAAVPILSVAAYVSQSGVHITQVAPREGQPSAAVASNYHVRVLDAAGHILSDTPMNSTMGHTRGGGVVTLLRARVPAQSAAARVEITENGNVVATRTRSPQVPSIRLLSPKDGDRLGQPVPGKLPVVVVQWQVTGPDTAKLWTKVDYSADDGHTWKTVFSGQNQQQVELPTAYFSASTQARVRVRVNDGFNEVSAVSGSLTSLGSLPVVRIVDPAPGARFATGSLINLAGNAYDDSFHPLKGEQLQWYAIPTSTPSDGSGQTLLGTGEKITISSLPPGAQSVVLEARDANGRVGKASVELQIVPQAPFFILLDAPKTLRSQDVNVVLRVAASRPATLIIGDSRFPVTTKPAPITLPVPATTKILRLDLQLTADGMTRHGLLRIVREPDPCQSIEDAISSINQEITTLQDELSNPDLPPAARAALGKQLRLLNQNLSSEETQLKNCEQQHP